MCDPLFSSCKEIKTYAHFIVSLSIRKEQRVLGKEKEIEKRGSFAFRVCRNQSEGQGASSFIHHKDLQPSSEPMASGMYMHLICICFQFLRCIWFFDPWFNLIRIRVLLFPTRFSTTCALFPFFYFFLSFGRSSSCSYVIGLISSWRIQTLVPRWIWSLIFGSNNLLAGLSIPLIILCLSWKRI